jgi:predicted MFS family arabinose efflux permease
MVMPTFIKSSLKNIMPSNTPDHSQKNQKNKEKNLQPNLQFKHQLNRQEFWILLTLAGIQFTHILDFMIMMPMGPQLRMVFDISDAKFGTLVSSYSFAAGFSGLFAAFYMDRFSRKKLLLFLYTLFAISTLACGLAFNYETLIFARISAGIFGGVLTALSQTIVADIIPQDRRGRAMGIVMSSFSISTVLGVPLGLFLANHFNWQTPFLLIAAISAVLIIIAYKTMPTLREHLVHQKDASALYNFWNTFKNRDHQNTLLFTFIMIFVGFTIIPYITLYMTANTSLNISHIPYIYLCGGLATLISARLIGRATDLYGKVKLFRLLTLITILPVFALTMSEYLPAILIFVVTTLFFIFVSGRMIPAMAITTSACNPKQRGTFMALNSAVQSLGMSSAAFLGGLIISRDPQGLIHNYWGNGLVGICASLFAFWWVGRLRLNWPTD